MSELPTLYRLADGTQGDPAECKADDKGVMRHKNGVPVVIDSDGKPVEIKREAEVNMTAKAATAGKEAEDAAKAVNDGEKPVEPPVKASPGQPAVEPKPVDPPKV